MMLLIEHFPANTKSITLIFLIFIFIDFIELSNDKIIQYSLTLAS